MESLSHRLQAYRIRDDQQDLAWKALAQHVIRLVSNAWHCIHYSWCFATIYLLSLL